jgi:hypothetical protein
MSNMLMEREFCPIYDLHLCLIFRLHIRDPNLALKNDTGNLALIH